MPGQTKKVQSAHIGYKSRLWKVVTVDGVEKERTILHTDTYNPSKAIVLVGPAAPEVPPAVENPAQPSEITPEQAAPAETAAPQPSQSQVVGPGAASQPSENSSGGPAQRRLLRQRVPGSSKRAHVFEQVRQQKRSDVSACTGIRCERFELI